MEASCLKLITESMASRRLVVWSASSFAFGDKTCLNSSTAFFASSHSRRNETFTRSCGGRLSRSSGATRGTRAVFKSSRWTIFMPLVLESKRIAYPRACRCSLMMSRASTTVYFLFERRLKESPGNWIQSRLAPETRASSSTTKVQGASWKLKLTIRFASIVICCSASEAELSKAGGRVIGLGPSSFFGPAGLSSFLSSFGLSAFGLTTGG